MNEENSKTTVEATDIANGGKPGTALRLPLTVFDGHLLVDIDGRRALIDTGCPVTLGTGEPLLVAGKVFPLAESFRGITLASVAEPVGCPLDLLVGMDVLGSFETTFSLANSEVVLAETATAGGEMLRAGAFFGVPTMPVVVNGETHDVIFDTGAPISYLSERLVSGFEFVETRTDFYPTKGTFDVDVYKVPVTVGSTERTLEIGAMKGLLAEKLEPAGMRGILGTGILEFTDVTVSMAREAITLTGQEAA